MNAPLFILGMHRSGTSCLAGCLRACGLWLGPVAGAGVHNARGNQELQLVVSLNTDLLRASGGAWDRAPSSTAPISWHLSRRMHEVMALMATAGNAGIKDPLLLLVLEHWQKVAPPAALVGSFRHPLEVARSLEARQAIGHDDALDLWVLYNTALVRHHRERAFPLIEFDLSDPAGYLQRVSRIAHGLGLEADVDAMATFADPELQHHRVEEPVPALCASLYDYLKENV